MSHVLVTGGGGFIGGRVVDRLLAQGDRVRVLARGEYPALAGKGVELIRGDVSDRDAAARACAGVDLIFHVAAKASVGLDFPSYERTNLHGTEVMLEAARKAEVRRFVFTSTPSVVFSNEGHVGVDESAPLTQSRLSPYAFTKARAEERVRAANSDTLRTVAVRPHLVWGPDDPQVTARLVDRARRGKLALVGDGQAQVDTTYVDNVVDAHVLAADALAHGRAGGQAYFISNGEPMPVEEIVSRIVEACGAPRPTRHVSLGAATMVGSVLEFVYRTLRLESEPPMTRFLAISLATPHWFDLGAARRDLGYSPRVSIAEGLARLRAWAQSRP